MSEPMHDFPRWGLVNRVIHEVEVEDELSSLPMVLLTPILSAILATTLAASLPASQVHDGTVEGPSVPLSVGLAVAGAVSGLVLVGIVLTVWFWHRYLRRGDPRFRPGADHPYGNVFPLGLTCTGRFDAQTLGTFEAWVKHPRARSNSAANCRATASRAPHDSCSSSTPPNLVNTRFGGT
jgi:hypothetical protein